MDLRESPLYADAMAIMDAPAPRAWFQYSAIVRLPNGELLPAIKVTMVDIIDNYLDAFSSVQTIELVFGLGTYIRRIYPHRSGLEIILRRTRTVGDNVDETVLTYRGIAIDTKDPSVDVTGMADSAEFTLDVSNIYAATFQLIDTVLDQLRAVTTGGVYRKTNMRSVLQSSLTAALETVDADSAQVPLGIHLEGDPNEREFEQIVIPHGTSLFDVPGYLQEKCGGVYPTGLGHFIRGRHWYIYPLYDIKRNTRSDGARLEILVLPQSQFDVLDKTHTSFGSVTMVICAGDRASDTGAETAQQNDGEGTRFVDAKALISGLVNKDQENKAIISRGSNVNEFSTEPTKSGFSLAPMSDNTITDNPFREMSKLASLKGLYFNCVWNYSDVDILHPGMLARIKLLDGNQLRVVEGVLLGAHSVVQLYGKGLASSSHYHSTALTFFIERDVDDG